MEISGKFPEGNGKNDWKSRRVNFDILNIEGTTFFLENLKGEGEKYKEI